MTTFKTLMTIMMALIITACSSTDVRDFMRAADTTGITKIATQSSVDEEKRIAREKKEELEKDKLFLREVEFRLERDKWIGKNSDDLVMAWGNPTETYNRNDGGKHYTYKIASRSVTDVWTNQTTYYYCFTNFITNPRGKILAWTSKGTCAYHQK